MPAVSSAPAISSTSAGSSTPLHPLTGDELLNTAWDPQHHLPEEVNDIGCTAKVSDPPLPGLYS